MLGQDLDDVCLVGVAVDAREAAEVDVHGAGQRSVVVLLLVVHHLVALGRAEARVALDTPQLVLGLACDSRQCHVSCGVTRFSLTMHSTHFINVIWRKCFI